MINSTLLLTYGDAVTNGAVLSKIMTSVLMEPLVYPAIFYSWKRRSLPDFRNSR